MPASLLDGLNPQQLEAVTLPQASALVLAGAGSGKTRVLTTRIAWLIQSGIVSPHGILAVTFTNKAAREMITRVAAMLPIDTRGMWIGTFHGLCNRMLRAHHRDAGLPQTFQILDSADQLSAVKRVMKAMSVDEERYPPRKCQWFIASAKEQGLRAHQVEAHDDISRRYAEVYAAYDEQCQREGAVDFAELLLRCFELLDRNEILREHYRSRFHHILVDEFQDTNRLQYLWLKLLAGEGGGLFAVGDDDQSIYAFRGANVRNMADLERDFDLHKVIKLEQNYRSLGNILDAANALIRHNRDRLGKNLWTSEGKGEPIRVLEGWNDEDEARYVVEESRALAGAGLALSAVAVLYRSNAQSRVIEHALFSAGLPYRVYGGLRFFERQEVKHALAYLRLVANPEDDGALLRVINFPTRGIGDRTLQALQEAARAADVSLWQAALQRCGPRAPGAEPPRKGVEAFVALVEAMRAACHGLPLPEQVEHVVEASGLAEHYRNEREGADRLANLEELVSAATTFGQEDREVLAAEGEGVELPQDPLAMFLAHAALESGEYQAAEGRDALQLMTVHAAKGLEFHTVFVTGLEAGLFPHENSLNAAGGLEEERRLMYVAITRARRRLHITYAQRRMLHGQVRDNLSSPFLSEIPDSLLSWVRGRRNGYEAPRAERREAERPRARESSAGYRSGARAAGGWRVGQNVVHPKFGQGIIVDAEGRGAEARVQVHFDSAGTKWLMLEFAKLTPS